MVGIVVGVADTSALVSLRWPRFGLFLVLFGIGKFIYGWVGLGMVGIVAIE